MEYHGSIRIKKAATLQGWIDKGWYQREIDNGYTFAYACGRFRIGKCQCSICKKNIANELVEIINALKIIH